jgi:hypothetical protein
MAKKALENILADPYGVVIFNDHIALNLRLGELLTRQAEWYGEIEGKLPLPVFTPTLFDKLHKLVNTACLVTACARIARSRRRHR